MSQSRGPHKQVEAPKETNTRKKCQKQHIRANSPWKNNNSSIMPTSLTCQMEKTRKMIVLQTNQPTETLSGHDTLDNMQIKNMTGQPIHRVMSSSGASTVFPSLDDIFRMHDLD